MLIVKNLNVKYTSKTTKKLAIQDISFAIEEGKIFGIVGESGSGKSTIANAILQMLPESANITGQFYFKGNRLSSKNISNFRGSEISYISQNFYRTLSDYYKVGHQFEYLLKSVLSLSKTERKNYISSKLKDLGFDKPKNIMKKYPFQLAGGMRQRVNLAMALSCNPSLLIADEPSTAVDAITKKKLLSTLYKQHNKQGLGIILISHNLNLIAEFCDDISVMLGGQIIEKGRKKDVIFNPKHPYTKCLIDSKPNFGKKLLDIKKIMNDEHAPCPYYNYCKNPLEICKTQLRYHSSNGRYIKCNRGYDNANS